MVFQEQPQAVLSKLVFRYVHGFGNSIRIEHDPIALLERSLHSRVSSMGKVSEVETVFKKLASLSGRVFPHEQRGMAGTRIAKRAHLRIDQCIRRRDVMALEL